jgi:transposase
MTKKAYLGIDVSKGYADFILLDEQCKIMEPFFQLSDTDQGRKELKQLIENWAKQGVAVLYCGVESTGGYENNWHSFLKGLQAGGGIWVSRLNAKAVKSVSDASLRRTITDEVSAENIAMYLAKFPEKVDYGLRAKSSSERFTEGRQFITCIQMWVKQKVQLNNQLEKLLYQNLPEMLVYCRNGTPTWLLCMLVKFPSISTINKAGEAKLAAVKGITKEKAQAILNKTKQTQRPTSSTLEHLISTTAAQILSQQQLITTNKALLNNMYQQDASVKLLTGIKGIGLDSAVTIILEIEDVDRFGDVKKMASFFGLHPTFKQSGDGKWGNHMSKKGRGNIRAALYMTSLSAVRYNPLFKDVYARFRAKGMSHKQAAGVVMHKMLRVIYGVLKSGKAFDVEVEQKHRERAAEKQQENKEHSHEQKKDLEQKKQRFQTYVAYAPISGRNLKTRKKQLASQASTEVCTGSPTAEANL